MPYIQIETGRSYPPETKRRVAELIGALYCSVMQARDNIVSVVFRGCGENDIYRTGNSTPRPVGVISCDIRTGRPARQRTEFAHRLVALCEQELGVIEGGYVVYFTEHDGAEIFRDKAPGTSWSPNERS
jgi:phenylpyruvate tautomerase PptA (4-oxalocrotonate tautomerase family)